MKLVNIDKNLAKNYINNDKTVLVCKLMPYKNNTCIKVYTEEGEPIGDIEESFISQYLQKDSEVFFVSEEFDDDTGLFDIVIKTIV